MDSYGTEEDQIRAIRQWWERNGSSTLIGVGLALGIVFGSQWWQQRTHDNVEQASMLYQQLVQSVENATGDKVQQATAEHLAGELKTAQSGTRYGDYASLMLARLYIEKGEPAAAESELRDLLGRQPDAEPGLVRKWLGGLLGRQADPHIGALARVRLARVLFAQGRPDDALAELDAAGNDDFALEKLELRGDILRGKGDPDAAHHAYSEAQRIAASAPGAGVSRLLELKIQELELLGHGTKNPSADPGDKS